MIGKVLLDIDRVLFWPCMIFWVAGMFGWVRGDRGAKELPSNRVRFGANWIGISWIGVMITIVPTTVTMFLHQRADHFALVAPIGISIILTGFLLELPGIITLSDGGLEQQYWFGRNKHIRWDDIAEIDSGPKDRRVTIKAVDGTRIYHSFLHSGRVRLLRELKLRCGDELPADFPREPLENA